MPYMCQVIATKSGGPMESVAHGTTGLLCEPSAEAFGEAIAQMILDLPATQKVSQHTT